jgi:hypothetical protein
VALELQHPQSIIMRGSVKNKPSDAFIAPGSFQEAATSGC